MKTKNRPKSKNVDDRRSAFGSNSLSGMNWQSKVSSFVGTSMRDAASNKSFGMKFTKNARKKK